MKLNGRSSYRRSYKINHTELLKNVFETIKTSIIYMYCLEQILTKKCFPEKSLRFGQRFPSCHLLRRTTSKSATFEEQAAKFHQQRNNWISTCYKNETFTESRAIQTWQRGMCLLCNEYIWNTGARALLFAVQSKPTFTSVLHHSTLRNGY